MSNPTMQALYDQYAPVLEKLENTFKSHEFILKLAQDNQSLYIQALADYYNSPTPFKVVHGQLAKQLHYHADLLARDVPSVNIWGENDVCSQWRKRP